MRTWCHQTTPYEVLGVTPEACSQDITTAFRAQLKQTHPDRNPGDDTNARTQLLIAARALLLDDEARRQYDRHRGQADTNVSSGAPNPQDNPRPQPRPTSDPAPAPPDPTLDQTEAQRTAPTALRRWQRTGWPGRITAGLCMYLMVQIPAVALLLGLLGALGLWQAHRRGGVAGALDHLVTIPATRTAHAAFAAYAAQFFTAHATALAIALGDIVTTGHLPDTAMLHAALLTSTAQLIHRLHRC